MNTESLIKRLKKVSESMEQQLLKDEERIESRETTFEDRSFHWQESEKGEEWVEETNRLQDLHDEGDAIKDDLDGIIDSLEELEQ